MPSSPALSPSLGSPPLPPSPSAATGSQEAQGPGPVQQGLGCTLHGLEPGVTTPMRPCGSYGASFPWLSSSSSSS